VGHRQRRSTVRAQLRSALVAVLAAVTATAVVVIGDAAPAGAETIRQQQWHLDALHVLKAQQITKGAGVVVAVIETGVDASHPDLSGHVLAGTAMLGATNPEGQTDPVGHGTLMAALIAGKGGGANHALGIAPQAKILPIAGLVRLARIAEARRRIASGWYDRSDVRDRLVTAVLHEVRGR